MSSTRAKTFELHFNPIANEIELYCPGKGSFSIATDLAPLNLSLGNGSDHGVILGKSCYYSMETLRNQMVFNSDIFSLGLGLTSLKVLNLKPRATRKNQISLSRSSFESISSLGVKVVNVEVSIGQLGNSCFESLKDSLEEISIKNTAIKQIPNDTFSGLSGLKTLKIISNSDINETFAPDLFKGLISLETLLLRQNNQSYLHESSFRELISLKYLDIGGNRFRTIPINIFELNANLEELKILNDCNTHNLSPCSRSLTSDLLKPLTKLQSFSYSLFNRDPCANFTQDFFRHSTYSLSQVRISHACLPNDDLSVFQSLQRVKTIDASENNIVSVENFVPNSNLKSLNLYQNLLKCTCDNVQALRTWNRTVDLGKKLRIACKPNNLSLERARAKLQCQFLMEMPVFWVGCAVAILTLALAVFLYALRSRRATWRRDSFYDESGEFDAFLSYCDEDKELAHHIKDTLEAREGSASTSEMQIFIHEQHFDAGPPILENIARAVDQSRCTVLIISKVSKDRKMHYSSHDKR